jgi:hypothetical protein
MKGGGKKRFGLGAPEDLPEDLMSKYLNDLIKSLQSEAKEHEAALKDHTAPNSRSVLDEKRPTKEQKAQHNYFHDVACDPSLFYQSLHAVLPVGLAADDEAIPRRSERHLGRNP